PTAGAPRPQELAHDVAVAQRLAVAGGSMARRGRAAGRAGAGRMPGERGARGWAIGSSWTKRFHQPPVGDPLPALFRGARPRAITRTRGPRPVARPLATVPGLGQGGVGLGVPLAEDLG